MVSATTDIDTVPLHTVLILSDQSTSIAIWEPLFNQRNCIVLCESNISNALQGARLVGPSLMLVDLQLTKTERASLLKELREASRGPIIMLVSANTAQEVFEANMAGADECLITVKGAEAPAHMPHAKRSLGLIYAVNPFGADHQSSEHDPYYEEGVADLNLNRLKLIGLSEPQPGYSLTPEKVRFAYLTEVFYSMLDSAELCQFVFGPAWTLYGPAETVEMIRAVTGWDITVEELMAVGERRLNLFRAFNAREGLDRKADKLPRKFFKQLKGSGPTVGVALTHEEIESALDEYYRMAGWTSNGIPTAETMQRLDIAWAM